MYTYIHDNSPSRLGVLKAIRGVRVADVCSALRPLSRPNSLQSTDLTRDRPKEMKYTMGTHKAVRDKKIKPLRMN